MILANQAAVTPAGIPVGVPMPVAPGVLIVILVMAMLGQTVGFEEGEPAQPIVIYPTVGEKYVLF